MINIRKKILATNHLHKIYALISGYCVWLFLGQSNYIDMTYQVPLCFYGDMNGLKIEAPQHVTISTRMKRTELFIFDHTKTTAYICVENLKTGKNTILLSTENFLLPNTVQLLAQDPAPLSIIVQKLDIV